MLLPSPIIKTTKLSTSIQQCRLIAWASWAVARGPNVPMGLMLIYMYVV